MHRIYYQVFLYHNPTKVWKFYLIIHHTHDKTVLLCGGCQLASFVPKVSLSITHVCCIEYIYGGQLRIRLDDRLYGSRLDDHSFFNEHGAISTDWVQETTLNECRSCPARPKRIEHAFRLWCHCVVLHCAASMQRHSDVALRCAALRCVLLRCDSINIFAIK